MAIPAWELSQIAADLAALFDKTANIKRLSKQDDGYGHKKGSYNTVGSQSSVACALTLPTGSYMTELAAKLTDVSAYTLLLPVGTDIAHADHIVIGSETYTVQNVMTPESNQCVIRALVSIAR